ncbi:MAG TPA: endonuclease/exonuclease/phosphatase family protein [Solirubrobacterales bacterium]
MRGASGQPNEGVTGRRVVAWALRAAAGLLALWALYRLLGLGGGYPFVALVAFTPYVAALSVLVLAAALLARRRWEAVAAAAVVGLLAVAVLPRAVAGQPTGPIPGGVAYDVLASNLRLGEADAEALARLAREGEVDLLSVQELTRDAAARLRDAGIDDLLPHQELSPTEAGSWGAGLYSRYPLERLADVPGGISRQVHALADVPGAGEVELVAVHPFPPTRRSSARWLAGLEGLPRASPERLRILPGDFNSTFDHAPFRDLVGSGYVDAAAARGKGLAMTWPSGRVFPPQVAIDHVLADERAHVADAEIHTVPGTDHRAVLARLELPPGTGAAPPG